MKVTIYYLDGRLVDKKDIPKNAIRGETKKVKDKWGGNTHQVFEKYYKTK